MTVISTWYDERRNREVWYTSSSTSDENMASDPDGNIIGTQDTGGSFVWLRQ